jgi:adenosylcobinamide-phosphate synthase
MPWLAVAAIALDAMLGEPRRWHPLVGLGRIVDWVENRLNPMALQPRPSQRWRGVMGVAVIMVPFTLLGYAACRLEHAGPFIDVLLLYFAVGHKSLHQHARVVSNALQANDDAAARTAASYMVSRDSAAIEPVPATVESVLENGNDGVFGPLFWFLVAGGTGALLFRLANTLDAMWGYKNDRFRYFGWAAARLDDVLDYIPARLTALSYALLGRTRLALNCWRTQAPLWDSPNAGPVMSAGAGALGIQLGGPARYHGEWHQRPDLGCGRKAVMADIERALTLVRHSVYLWLAAGILIAGVAHA